MHFGRVTSVEKIKFDLPEDPIRTDRFLSLKWQGKRKLYAACPIWGSKKWVGKLYPDNVKPGEYLKHYAENFAAIELNSTFYGLPRPDVVRTWMSQVGSEFRFCPKVVRTVTEKLGVAGWLDEWRRYCAIALSFEGNLGLGFAQFPEHFAFDSLPILKLFLAQIPQGVPLAVEFRHRSWFVGAALRDELIDLLYRHGVATVITDSPGRLDVRHLSLTQPHVMVRFNGHYLDPSDEFRLRDWAERIKNWLERGMDAIYFFIHQPDESLIPETVDVFRATMGMPPLLKTYMKPLFPDDSLSCPP